MSRKQEVFKTRIHKAGGYVFKFSEADEQSYLYAYKDGDSFDFILFAEASDEATGDRVARYEKTWESSNIGIVEQFIAKFMADAEFRKKFQTGGPAITATLDLNPGLINAKCAAAISRINSKPENKLRFRDYAGLKTYGRDKVSTMKWDVLVDVLEPGQLESLQEALHHEKDQLSVMRWVRRGLKFEKAIRKVKTDLEITQNCIDKW